LIASSIRSTSTSGKKRSREWRRFRDWLISYCLHQDPLALRLLRLAGNSPVEFEVEASLHGSSLNLNLPDWCGAMDFCDGYEAPAKKR
jgi:hypothetical protein